MKKTIRLTESDLTRIVKRVINESLDDEYNYDNEKGNPRTIVVKFAPGGEDEFLDQYILFNSDNMMSWYNSWWDLNHDGLEMKDGSYYVLFNVFNRKSLKKWEDSGTIGGRPTETYFLKYNKEPGEITIWSSNDYDLDVGPSKNYEFTELKPNSRYHTYCHLEGPNGESRLVTTGSRDHRGFFKIVDTKN